MFRVPTFTKLEKNENIKKMTFHYMPYFTIFLDIYK